MEILVSRNDEVDLNEIGLVQGYGCSLVCTCNGWCLDCSYQCPIDFFFTI